MDDYKSAISACCKQLRLSANLAENAMTQDGASHQEYLCRLFEDELKYRKESRIAKLLNTAGFPYETMRRTFLLRTVFRRSIPDRQNIPEGIPQPVRILVNTAAKQWMISCG